jgi:hypothetical protein
LLIARAGYGGIWGQIQIVIFKDKKKDCLASEESKEKSLYLILIPKMTDRFEALPIHQERFLSEVLRC